ncbi:MAG: NifB/NifX family molybdenum-iron cluster-binding protein [Thermoanaerobaculales bacterium]|nr:NifB/NifX family molybdenum-iron cluster-binding protein [Thermoanaerobaculales bacterium]
MIIAIPVNENLLSQHFGRCQAYAFFEIEDQTREIVDEKSMVPPVHEPGVLPAWIAQQVGNVVITGGMGPRAIQLFQRSEIEVILGAPSLAPREIVESYLDGRLQTGQSSCDHGNSSHGSGPHCS